MDCCGYFYGSSLCNWISKCVSICIYCWLIINFNVIAFSLVYNYRKICPCLMIVIFGPWLIMWSWLMSVLSFIIQILSLWNPKLSLACDILRNCYEAFALYAFGSYLIACLGKFCLRKTTIITRTRLVLHFHS